MTALGISPEVQKLLDNQRIKLAGAEVPANFGTDVLLQNLVSLCLVKK